MKDEINAFLVRENIQLNDIDLILSSGDILNKELIPNKVLNYMDYTGLHYSASSFATHIAHDYLNSTESKNTLIVNNLCKRNLGLILVSKT